MWPVAIAAGATVVGALISQAQNEKDSKRQQALLDQAREEYSKLQFPSAEDQQLFFEQLKSQGTYSPELEATFKLPDTELRNVTVDPQLKQAQMSALASLKDLGTTGMSAQDRLDVERSRMEQGAIAQRQMQGIQEGAARRGMSDSGLNAVMQQAAAQQQSNNANTMERDIQAQARQRALQALSQYGSTAGQMRTQDYGEKSEQAKAADMIAQFNVRNQQTVAGANVDRANQGQQYNLGNQQRIADANVGIRNQQQQLNKQAYQQEFENAMAKTTGMNSQTNSYLEWLKQKKQDNSDMWSGLIQGAGKAADSWNKGSK